jgi:hypothetical protein
VRHPAKDAHQLGGLRLGVRDDVEHHVGGESPELVREVAQPAAVALERADARRQFGGRLAAVEHGHVVTGLCQAAYDVPAEEAGTTEAQQLHGSNPGEPAASAAWVLVGATNPGG